MDMGIAWCSAKCRGCVSLIRVSSGEKMYAGGDEARAQVDRAARWFLPLASGSFMFLFNPLCDFGADIGNDDDTWRRLTAFCYVGKNCLSRQRLKHSILLYAGQLVDFDCNHDSL